jgi:hypothetical protein
VRKDDFGTKRLNTKKPVRPASPVDDEDESEISEDDGAFDDEDRTIAELEKKLGMGKGKKSKLGDEELDGSLLWFVTN